MGKVKIKDKKFVYTTRTRWLKERIGELSSSGKPKIEIATPPEFGGKEGIWSPEELFVASVNSCIMTTFLYFAEKEGLKFSSYESEAKGFLERGKQGFCFSHITLYPKIKVAGGKLIEKTKNVLDDAKRHCLVSNSIEAEVIVNPKITAKEKI